jgi:hypothetical protein
MLRPLQALNQTQAQIKIAKQAETKADTSKA